MIKLLAAIVCMATVACNRGSYAKKAADTDNAPAAGTTMNTLTEAQKRNGWQLLFDGRSTTGWHKYGGQPAAANWKVANGMLYVDTTKATAGQIPEGGDLVTDEAFRNFHLKLDWKIARGGNSGIIFYVQEDTMKYKNSWNTGPEMQALDNDGHPDAKIIKHRAGDLYDLVSSSKETVKKYGEWNTAEIKCVNGKLDFFLNGENVISTQMWDEGWKKLVAGSKFANMPGFGTFRSGKFALQDHGNAVWFRNVMIKKL